MERSKYCFLASSFVPSLPKARFQVTQVWCFDTRATDTHTRVHVHPPTATPRKAGSASVVSWWPSATAGHIHFLVASTKRSKTIDIGSSTFLEKPYHDGGCPSYCNDDERWVLPTSTESADHRSLDKDGKSIAREFSKRCDPRRSSSRALSQLMKPPS